MIQHKHNRAIAGRIIVQPTKPAQTFSTQMQSPSFRRRILDAAKRGAAALTYWTMPLMLIIPSESSMPSLLPWLTNQVMSGSKPSSRSFAMAVAMSVSLTSPTSFIHSCWLAMAATSAPTLGRLGLSGAIRKIRNFAPHNSDLAPRERR